MRLAVELGYLIEAPVYEENRRGTNWCATISLDPRSPGGIRRTWWERGKGDYLYLVPANIKVGTPVEFGADYTSARGRRSPLRWYGVVREFGPDYLILDECSTAREAVERSREIAASSASAPKSTPDAAIESTPDLSGVDDSTLAAELTRRGWVVFAPTADIPGRGLYAVVVADGRVRVGMVGVTIPADDAGIVYRGEPSDCVYLARRLVRAGLDTDSPALR